MIIWVKHWVESVFLSLDPHIKSAHYSPHVILRRNMEHFFSAGMGGDEWMSWALLHSCHPQSSLLCWWHLHKKAKDAAIWCSSAGKKMTVCRDLERDLRDHRSPHPVFMRKLRSEGEVTRSSLAKHAPLRNDSKTEAGKCTPTLSHAHSVSLSHTQTHSPTLTCICSQTPGAFVLSEFSYGDILERRGGNSFFCIYFISCYLFYHLT